MLWQGVGLAATNLVIDGFTNAEQDRLNRQHHPSPFWMMACVNVWGVLFALAYLLGGLAMYGPESQLSHAYSFFVSHPAIQRDLLHFCLANAFGQVFIFSTIKVVHRTLPPPQQPPWPSTLTHSICESKAAGP